MHGSHVLSSAAAASAIIPTARLWRFGGGGDSLGWCAATDQRLLGLGVEQVKVVGIDGDVDVLPWLDVVAAWVVAGGQRHGADVQIGGDLTAHALDDVDLALDLGQGVAPGEPPAGPPRSATRTGPIRTDIRSGWTSAPDPPTATKNTEMSARWNPKLSGVTDETYVAYMPPAIAATPAPKANMPTFIATMLTPAQAAAVSSSRIDLAARPIRDRSSQANTAVSTTTSGNRQFHGRQKTGKASTQVRTSKRKAKLKAKHRRQRARAAG